MSADQFDIIITELPYQVNKAMMKLLSSLPPDISVQMLDLGFELSDIPGRDEIVSRIRKINGQVDPNAISAEKLGPALLPLLLPFAVLAIPLADLLMAITRRLFAGKSPFTSDKEHLHHRILRAGNSHLRTAVILYLWTATIAFPVTVSAFAPLWVAAVVAVFLLGLTLYISKPGKRAEVSA